MNTGNIIQDKTSYCLQLIEQFENQHMKPEVKTLSGDFMAFQMETDDETITGPYEDRYELTEHVKACEVHSNDILAYGFMWRMSANGYLDATDWTASKDIQDLVLFLEDEVSQINPDFDFEALEKKVGLK